MTYAILPAIAASLCGFQGPSTAAPSQSAAAYHTPAVNTPERRAILDALRVPIQKSLNGRKPLFKIQSLRVAKGWAFMTGFPLGANGKPIDIKGTVYESAAKEGLFDNNCCGLLQAKGAKWVVRAWAFGSTDVPWDGWDVKYGAPRSIFPYN